MQLNNEQILLKFLEDEKFFNEHINELVSIHTINMNYFHQIDELKKRRKEKNVRLFNYYKQLFIAYQEKNKLIKQQKQTLKTLKEIIDLHGNNSDWIKRLKIIREQILDVGSKNKKFLTYDLCVYEQSKIKPVLFVRNLTKYYRHKKISTIDNLTFNVYPGEFHAFIGANGAGKTTTIKSLITSYYNWSGTVLINGYKNTDEKAKAKIGYIPEKAVFPENLSTYEYLKWMVLLSGVDKAKAKQHIEEQLKSFGMWNMRKRSPNTFSSGQKKKILLIQTLIHDPDIIIMDEPVANLDPKARIDFFDQLIKLKAMKKSIFISSHVLAELDVYADSLTILDGGKIVYSGKKDTLLKKYDKKEYALTLEIKHHKTLIKYLDENKIEYSINEEHNETFIIKNINEKQLEDLQMFLISHKLFFQSFNKINVSLEDIYRKLIVYGSRDTMQENIANNKTEGETRVKHAGKIY
ncbi:ABC transporter ATP-binding protein [Candidatus Malacoplasma girerdii]|uniref:ABC transporter ATP-binding protein n=1 Tax=Candidatus Malacoplasma girerdii TaxID=1318617 RepID=A0A097ST92_9BACT|nr:ABC transporter ATP-binding protein [Candidatus Malacoplasma girerdii]